MKVFILVYNGFANFEVVLTALFMKSKGEIITVGTSMDTVTAEESFKLIPHISLSQVKAEEVDLFVIPGGNHQTILDNKDLAELLIQLNSMNKPIAAICSAPIHFARCGILDGKNYTTSMPVHELSEFSKGIFHDQNVVVDGNIITAKGNGYVDFAITLGKVMNIYEDENDMKETIEYFKFFKG